MPLVRISHAAGKSSTLVVALSKGVHQAMMDTFGVPADDYWQIITEHVPETGLIGPMSFLGIDHTADLVFIQITCAEGRTLDQKKAFYAAIADHISKGAGGWASTS